MAEENVIIGKGTPFPLNGILSLPESGFPVPAVVLVHGSGPQDADEKIGNNTPFKDIADSLWKQGIAVLRYNKRTLIYGKQMVKDAEEITVEEETIQDAILATELLRKDDRIDGNRVFILGHSLGGMLAPRIDAEGGNFAGIIIMAGSPRTLISLMKDQSARGVEGLKWPLRPIAKKQVLKMNSAFDSIPAMSDEEAKRTKVIGKTCAYYFKEMEAHPASDYLSELSKPILILQGEKDFQVFADKDFQVYKLLLVGKENVTMKLYPELNHLMMVSTTGDIKEYKKPSKVDSNVLMDIAGWIRSH